MSPSSSIPRGLPLCALALLTCHGHDAPRPGAVISATCIVDRVADGDTITCRDGNRIRLVGIDAPELNQPPFGRESQAALERLVPPGTPLGVELAADPVDDFDRTLAYLWDDRTMINEAMVRGGWAIVFLIRPNVRYENALRAAEREAIRQHTGHWSTGGFACRPVEHRRGSC